MKLEQQVTSLEISKKLKELGVKQESLFGWRKGGLNIPLEEWRIVDTQTYGQQISAFTVAELVEMLPEIKMPNRNYIKDKYCGYIHSGNIHQLITADTEADARGKMLIYLLENKLLS